MDLSTVILKINQPFPAKYSIRISSFLIVFALASSTFATVGTLPLVTDPPPGVDTNDSDYKAGYLNVTKAPYNADPTGATDATQNIQNAIDDARDYNLACFFPSGTYLISDTIEGRQLGSYNSKNKWIPERTKPCVLIGSKIGPRPVLKLNNDANGFTSGSWKAAVIMWTQSGPSLDPSTNDSNSNFNQVFSGIDINLGTGNKKAVGIWFTASQGSCLENVKVYSEDDKFHIGCYSSPGQGGGAYNVEVIGGDYGYYGIVDTRYPMLAGCTFQDQAIAPVYYEGKQPLVLVGCHFINTANKPIVMQNEGNQRLSFIDCVVEIPGTFVENDSKLNLYMENVYLKGVTTIVKKGSGQWNVNNSSVWTRVNEYAYCKSSSYKNLINGSINTSEYKNKKEDVGEPPEDLLKIHQWDETEAPSFEDSDAVNVKTDLGSNNAKGDGSSDDTASLQYAIDNYDKVFLPKGIYRITNSLLLHKDTKFFGVPSVITRIAPKSSWNPSTNKALIKTDDDADATTVLSDIYIDLHPDRPNLTPVVWSAGRKSVVSQVLIGIEERTNSNISADNHMLHIKDSGGGRWKTVCGAWQMLNGLTANANTRLLLVENTTEPLHMYAVNTERTLSDVQAEILNSQNVSIYFYKSEAGSAAGGGDDKTTLRINSSDNVAVYGMSGAIELNDINLPILDLIDSDNIVITHAKTFKSFADFPALTVRENYFGTNKTLTSDKGISLFRRGNPSRVSDGILTSPPQSPNNINKNLVMDPSFEFDHCEWITKNPSQVHIDNSPGAQDGNVCLTIQPASGNLYMEQWIAVNPNHTYTISGYLRLDGNLQAPSGKGAFIQIKMYEKDQLTAIDNGNKNICGGAQTGTQGWTYYEMPVLMDTSDPDPVESIRLRLVCNDGDTNPGALARFDQISIVDNDHDNADYLEDFDDNNAQNWNYNISDFELVDNGNNDLALQQVSDAEWGFATSGGLAVHGNYTVAVDGRVVGNRASINSSPMLVIKHNGPNDWIYIYIEQLSSGITNLKLKKKINGIASTIDIPETLTLQDVDVHNWHTLEVEVRENSMSVWVNGKLEAKGHIDNDLTHPNFDTSTQCGVRSEKAGVLSQFDNFKFWNE